MTLAIYWGSGSPNAWRVLLAAEVLGLRYESKLLEFSKGEHRTPEFLALNPRGKVPVIRDGDFVLYESLAILQYLDRLGSGALYGTTPREVAVTQRIISEFECYVREPLAKVLRHLLVVGGAPPTPQTPTVEQAAAANETMRLELATLSGLVKTRAWLSGERFGAADAAIYPYVRLLLRAVSKAEARARALPVPVLRRVSRGGPLVRTCRGTTRLRANVPAALARRGRAMVSAPSVAGAVVRDLPHAG